MIKTLHLDANISHIIKRIFNLLNHIPRSQFYHVLRIENTNTNEMYNKGKTLLKGDLDWQVQLTNGPLP